MWRHFGDSLDGLHVYCVLCKETDSNVSLKIKDGSTKPLRTHLAAFHKEHWKDIVSEEEKIAEEKENNVKKAAQKKSKDVANQPTVQAAFHRLTKTDPNGARQADYDKKLLEFLACTLVPFNVVDTDEYKRLVELLDKTINLKTSRTYYTQMEKFSDELLQDVMKAV